MSPYTKQTWVNGSSSTPLSDTRLNYIEEGIKAAMEAAETASGPAGTITSVTATALAAGASPTVTLGGAPSARTIALGIPAGAAGSPGATGPSTVSVVVWSGSAYPTQPASAPTGVQIRYFVGPEPYAGATWPGVVDLYAATTT